MKKFLVFVITFFLSVLGAQKVCADTNDEILYISSYGTDAKYINEDINSFMSTYMKMTNSGTIIAIENMNCNTISEASTWKNRMKNILHKHPGAKLIILLGSEAAVSYFSQEEEIYKKLPVYCLMLPHFCSAVEAKDSIPPLVMKPEEDPNNYSLVDMTKAMTSFNVRYARLYKYEAKKLIDLSLRCFPERKNFVVISDNSLLGVTYLRTMKKEFKQMTGITYHFIDGRYRDMLDAAGRFKEMSPEHSVAMLCNWRVDSRGTLFMNNGMSLFSRVNNAVPIFCLTGSGLGYWSIGGYIPDYENHGQEIAERAYKEFFLGNEQPVDIKDVGTTLNIDRNVWETWDLKYNAIPLEANIINEPPSIFSNITGSSLFFTLNTLIFIALIIGIVVALRLVRKQRSQLHTLSLQHANLVSEHTRLEKQGLMTQSSIDKYSEINQFLVQIQTTAVNDVMKKQEEVKHTANILYKEVFDEANKDLINMILQLNSEQTDMLHGIMQMWSSIQQPTTDIKISKIDLTEKISDIIDKVRSSSTSGYTSYAFKNSEHLLFDTDERVIEEIVTKLLNGLTRIYQNAQIEVSYKFVNNQLRFNITATSNYLAEDTSSQTFTPDASAVNMLLADMLPSKLTIIKMGGNINIDKDLKNGTRFIFQLPITLE